MKKFFALVLLGSLVLPAASLAIDLKQAKFTQVINSVSVISAADQSPRAAAVNDVFKTPDVLRTGPNSRAELVAADSTITRVGANTIFSFDPANRVLNLLQGSLLLESPSGKGGGTIRTASATASVFGETVIVAATPNGGFKVVVLEGQAEIRFLNGLHQTLQPGQMTFVLPGGGTSPIVVFRLDDLVNGSLLVNGFTQPLPSQPQIYSEIVRQLLQMLNNNVQDTGLLAGNNATPDSVQVVMDILNQKRPSGGFNTHGQIVGSDKTAGDLLPVNYNPPTVPLDPNHLKTGSFSPPDITSLTKGWAFLRTLDSDIGVSPASGFVGSKIDIDTANVDLGAFAGKSDFDIMAAGDMHIWQSLNFSGMMLPATIALFAGGQMLVAPGSTLEADTKVFGLAANSFGTLLTAGANAGSVGLPNTLENVSIYNNVGDVDILSLSDLTIEGMNSGYTVYAGGNVALGANGNLTVKNSSFYNDFPGYGNIKISAGNSDPHGSESLTLDNDYLEAGIAATVSAPGNVSLLDNTRIYATGADAAVSAGGVLDFENSYIEADNNVMLTGNAGVTLNGSFVKSDASAGTVGLNSASGQTTIKGSFTVAAFYINVNSPDGILLDGTGGGSISGNHLTLTAGNGDASGGPIVNVPNVDLSGFQAVNISGHTVYLFGDTFNINIPNNFICWNGAANIDNSAAPSIVVGDVNIHDSYTRNGSTGPTTLISNQSQLNVTGGTTPVNTAGLNIVGMTH